MGCTNLITFFLFLNCLNPQLQHPSAINMFDQIINKSKDKQIVIFLDYDGTLSPIVADPDKAFMTKKVFFFFALFPTLPLILL